MVRPFTISLILVTLLVGAIAGFAVAGVNAEPESQSRERRPEVQASTPDSEASLYTDQRYLNDMISQDEIALTLSKQVLVHTSRKEVRQLAGENIEVRAKRIAQMKSWLEEWK